MGYEYKGVVKWNNGIIKKYDHKDGLIGNSVRAINEDQNGNILFGTEEVLVFMTERHLKTLTILMG